MKQRLMDLYFTEGGDLSDREVLAQAAADVGLDAREDPRHACERRRCRAGRERRQFGQGRRHRRRADLHPGRRRRGQRRAIARGAGQCHRADRDQPRAVPGRAAQGRRPPNAQRTDCNASTRMALAAIHEPTIRAPMRCQARSAGYAISTRRRATARRRSAVPISIRLASRSEIDLGRRIRARSRCRSPTASAMPDRSGNGRASATSAPAARHQQHHLSHPPRHDAERHHAEARDQRRDKAQALVHGPSAAAADQQAQPDARAISMRRHEQRDAASRRRNRGMPSGGGCASAGSAA